MAPSNNTIETLNSLPFTDFRTQFWLSDNSIESTHDDLPWQLTLESSSTISPGDFDACFQLISQTSSKDYAASSSGWHPARKRKEMRLPDLKYVLLKQRSSGTKTAKGGSSNLDGFMSFMLTYEDGVEVIYCYEIHLEKRCQGRGLGRCLIKHMEEVGRKAGVKKAMLTVFRANETARRFYERLDYEEDEYSPRPKKLRSGVVKEADYVILSKSLAEDREDLRSEDASLKNKTDSLKNKNRRKRKAR